MRTVKLYLALLLFLIAQTAFGQTNVTHVYADKEGDFFSSSHTSPQTTDKSTILLGFKIGSITYSTGVDNSMLVDNGVVIDKSRIYKAFPAKPLIVPHIGVASNWEGVDQDQTGHVTTFSSNNSFSMWDGPQGLELGTNAFNLPIQDIKYKARIKDFSTENDAAILVTQTGIPPESAYDKFKFVDINGDLIGNEVEVKLKDVLEVGKINYEISKVNSDGTFTHYFRTDKDLIE